MRHIASYQTRYIYKKYLLRIRFYDILLAMMDVIKQHISLLRAEHGLSQAQVARFLGVPPKTLGDWLSGRTRCRHSLLLVLALEGLSARLRPGSSSGDYLKVG